MTKTCAPTGELAALLALAVGDEGSLLLDSEAVELVARSLDGDAAVLVTEDDVVFSRGFGVDSVPGDALVGAVMTGIPVGAVELSSMAGKQTHVESAQGLLVAECHGLRLAVVAADRCWSPGQQAMLAEMVQVLFLGRRTRTLVQNERALRAASQTQVAAHDELLASLREQRTLFERLSRIQRSISSRKPLQEVLDAIVAGAADLLGDDIVGLRLLDPDDPDYLVVAASRGVPDHLVGHVGRHLSSQGMGGRAYTENRLVLTQGYATTTAQLPGFTADGVRAAMAAPVRQGDVAVGSLTIASRCADRLYNSSEQEVLTAFAEHASLALNDAQAVQSLHRAVEDATHTALHDSLTGLPNRRMFLTRIAEAARADPGAPLSVLFIDLDDFKLVNDSLGHLVGDALLTAVGERVASCTRGPDTVGRLGGDEFAVLLPKTGDGPSAGIAHRVLAALQEPFSLSGQTVHVGASIGLVTSIGRRALSADGGSEELLRDADVAMYHAKAEGKHRCVTFLVAMRDRLQARTELESELRVALAEDRIVVHYQPVVDARTGVVLSTEALVRWQHPQHGLVSPMQFVSLAEDTGLIVPIGAAVLREACRQTAKWRARSDRPDLRSLCLSVNLSARQLQEPALVHEVRDALACSGLPAQALVLEITESLLVEDLDVALARLHRLKALGVRLAIDDFGTGYSSLSYLSRLPVDILKVDKAFVTGVADAQGAGRLASAVLALADSLELATVAEGVETQAQADTLTDQGCTMLQGFLYSKPVTAEHLPDAIEALTIRAAARVEVPQPTSTLSRAV